MRETYRGTQNESKPKFEVLGERQLAVHLPLPLVEVREELQPEVEHVTGLAGLKIIRAVIEDECFHLYGRRFPQRALRVYLLAYGKLKVDIIWRGARR